MSLDRVHSAIPGIPRSHAASRPIPTADEGTSISVEPVPVTRPEPVTSRGGEWGIPRPRLTTRPVAAEEAEDFFHDEPEKPPSGDEERHREPALIPRTLEPSIRAILAVGIGSVILVLGIQMASFAVTLRALPRAIQVVGGVAAGTLLILVGHGLFVLTREFVRLRQTPLVSRQALKQLEERGVTRRAARREIRRATRRLTEFLEHYPLDARDGSRVAALRRSGMTDEERLALSAQRERLRSGPQGDDQVWLEDVDRRFLAILDGVATRLIRDRALRTGLRTAGTPTGFLDAALMATGSVALVRDLCCLYHLRTDRWGTFLVLAHVMGNLIISSQTEDLMQESGENLSDWLERTLGTMAGSAAKVIGSRLAEGASNGLLLLRLGSVTQRALRPIALERCR